MQTPYLCGEDCTIADHALAPFVRQFANTDRSWFDKLPLPNLHRWLSSILTSKVFLDCMVKHPQWKSGDEPVFFGEWVQSEIALPLSDNVENDVNIHNGEIFCCVCSKTVGVVQQCWWNGCGDMSELKIRIETEEFIYEEYFEAWSPSTRINVIAHQHSWRSSDFAPLHLGDALTVRVDFDKADCFAFDACDQNVLTGC